MFHDEENDTIVFQPFKIALASRAATFDRASLLLSHVAQTEKQRRHILPYDAKDSKSISHEVLSLRHF